MRPKSEKNKIRDWNRSRRYRHFTWDEWVNFTIPYSMKAYFPKKEARRNGNRAVRRYPDMIPNGCSYKKIYDVDWEVW